MYGTRSTPTVYESDTRARLPQVTIKDGVKTEPYSGLAYIVQRGQMFIVTASLEIRNDSDSRVWSGSYTSKDSAFPEPGQAALLIRRDDVEEWPITIACRPVNPDVRQGSFEGGDRRPATVQAAGSSGVTPGRAGGRWRRWQAAASHAVRSDSAR
jgi:hypothetical protein